MLGRMRDTVADLAETLRRAFASTPCRELPLELPAPTGGAMPTLEAHGAAPDFALSLQAQTPTLLEGAALAHEALGFPAVLRAEEAWSAWSTGARVLDCPLFQPGGQARLEIPPLPRRPLCRSVAAGGFRLRVERWEERLRGARGRGLDTSIAPPPTRRDLERVLALPLAVTGEDPAALPKARLMRCSLQLVKATGENVRNLDILGIYPVPERGVESLGHDARTGRLLLHLASAASGARRRPFILARKKDDRTLVSCFLEDS